VASKGYDPVYSNDIGCYSLAAAPPIEMYNTMLCMGSGTGISAGLSQVQKRPVIAFAGDSTFFHSCIPPLVNAVYNKHNLLLIVLDNFSTAMTGFQPHPGTGISGMSESVPKIIIEDVARGVGVNHVFTVDPFDLKGAIKVISKALEITQEKGEVAVVVSRRKCSILTTRERKQNNISIIPWVVDPDVCTGCRICVDKFACPAISFSNEKAKIDPVICLDCGVCLQICPSKAIRRENQ
jgi:indolepyruvate ferredoxin oxidoreductase alpha subunit